MLTLDASVQSHQADSHRLDGDVPLLMPLAEARRRARPGQSVAVDCMLSAGWACIATLASVDPVRWRTTCLVLADAFGA